MSNPQIKDIQSCAVLDNGVKMPWLGFGVYKLEEGKAVEKAVYKALETGYRAIDTASYYQNEKGIGKGIKNSGLLREDLFITSKVWNSDQGYESTLKAFERSRRNLGLDYLDLYLVHWPVPGKYIETWRALEKLYQEGYVRAIGVSNFSIENLQDLMAHSSYKPLVNQIECHPLLTQNKILSFCQNNNIQVEAWSPLMKGNLDIKEIIEIGEKYNKTPAQVVLRWHLQREVIAIPKSGTPKRIEENADIFDFELSQVDMDIINSLNKDQRFGPGPDNFHLL